LVLAVLVLRLAEYKATLAATRASARLLPQVVEVEDTRLALLATPVRRVARVAAVAVLLLVGQVAPVTRLLQAHHRETMVQLLWAVVLPVLAEAEAVLVVLVLTPQLIVEPEVMAVQELQTQSRAPRSFMRLVVLAVLIRLELQLVARGSVETAEGSSRAVSGSLPRPVLRIPVRVAAAPQVIASVKPLAQAAPAP
jgi:hypothetical protein